MNTQSKSNGQAIAEAEKNEYTRINKLVESAIKASVTSLPVIAQGFAAAFLRFVKDGRADMMNKLHAGLSAKDAYAMTAFAIRSIMDKYAMDGLRDAEDSSKWRVRPTPILEFRANPSKDTPGEHFRIADIKNTKKYNAAQIKAIKATKRAIVTAGETELANPDFWTRPDAFKALESAFDVSAFRKRFAGILKMAAENAPSLGLSVNEIRNIGRVVHLDEKQLGAVLASFNDGNNKASDDDDNETGETTTPPATETRETVNA